MRLWLKDSERRPDPLPARTDARTALLVGTLLWLIALGAPLLSRLAPGEWVPDGFGLGAASAAGAGWWLWCAVIGVGLGLGALVWVQLRRR